MIFRLKKDLFSELDDYTVKDEAGNPMLRIATLKKAFWLYGRAGEQVGQIVFDRYKATICAASGSSLVLETDDNSNFFIASPKREKKDMEGIKASLFRQNLSQFQFYGKPADYCYDIYEKKNDEKLPLLRLKVINDVRDNGYYKIKIEEGANVLKMLMVAIAIDKLLIDPESRY